VSAITGNEVLFLFHMEINHRTLFWSYQKLRSSENRWGICYPKCGVYSILAQKEVNYVCYTFTRAVIIVM